MDPTTATLAAIIHRANASPSQRTLLDAELAFSLATAAAPNPRVAHALHHEGYLLRTELRRSVAASDASTGTEGGGGDPALRAEREIRRCLDSLGGAGQPGEEWEYQKYERLATEGGEIDSVIRGREPETSIDVLDWPEDVKYNPDILDVLFKSWDTGGYAGPANPEIVPHRALASPCNPDGDPRDKRARDASQSARDDDPPHAPKPKGRPRPPPRPAWPEPRNQTAPPTTAPPAPGDPHGNDDGHGGAGNEQPQGFRTAASMLGRERKGGKKGVGRAGRAEQEAGRAVFGARRGSGDGDGSGDDLPEVPNVEPKLVEMIMNEIMDSGVNVEWEDIAGLRFAKKCVMEAVIWPMQRPDIFKGLRGPPKGLLLFGPPGTGKTMIGRAVASKSGSKFFNISASSLTSKWVGEGEKLVRALFAVARLMQPSVIFIDEIDSLLTQRTDSDQESSRRLKTEFLVQMDGAGTSRDDRVLVVGATNRPQELDEAARRRLVKRLYIPLPDGEARLSLVTRLVKGQQHSLSEANLERIVRLSKGYSGSDLYSLCAEAALGPIRDVSDISMVDVENVRSIELKDFEDAFSLVRSSVGEEELVGYQTWNKQYGSFPITHDEEAS